MNDKIHFNKSINEQIFIYNKIFVYQLISKLPLSIDYFRRALALVINKHTSLRTTLIYDQDKLTEELIPLPTDIYNVEITYVTSDEHMNSILLNEETNHSLLNFREGRVFRCHVLRYATINDNEDCLNQNDLIIFSFHHAVADNNSILIFINDLRTALGRQELHSHDREDIIQVNRILKQRPRDLSNARKYWAEVLQSWNYSTNQQEPLTRTPERFTVMLDLDHNLISNLTQFASQFNLTLFHLGLAAFYAFLFKMSNSEQHDLCIGIQVTDKQKYELDDVMDFFVNYLPCRIEINPYESFVQLCYRVQQIWRDMLPHSHLPFEEIIKLHPFLKTSPLRTLFLIESSINDEIQVLNFANGIQLKRYDQHPFNHDIKKFDLICIFNQNSMAQLKHITFNASADIYDQSTISTMINRFEYLLHQIFSNSSICQLSLLLSNETKVINDINNTYIDYDEIGCIHWNIAHQAQQHPQKISLILNNGSITYAELLYYTQYLASHLITKYGIQPGQVICQLVERSFEMIIGIIAIMMCGATYTGLSSREPLTRLTARIEQTNAQLVLIHYATQHILSTMHGLIDINHVISFARLDDENFSSLDSVNVTSDHISYIVFTSGSTGTPKGIQLRHRNFISYILSYIIQFNDIILHQTSVTFDAHIGEILGTTIMGSQLVILQPDGHLDMEIFTKTISYHQVTYMGTVPSQLTELIHFLSKTDEKHSLRTLHCISSGGETLYTRTVIDIMSYLNKNCHIYNLYGPAECTEAVTKHLVTKDDLVHSSLPLGRPIANVHIYLLDEYLQHVIPDIHIGEIVIGGAGVFAGYLGRPDLTDQVLCNINNEICYKTGDLGRLNLKTLSFEYCGRRDFQVKLRGQRIELGEIESIIMEIASMCIVIKISHLHNEYLVAYVQTKSNENDLREYCSSRLPLYMVPSFFVIVEKFPLNQNGKIDRKALPKVDFDFVSDSLDTSNQPLTDMERRVFEIWCEVLPHVKSIRTTTTSFFSLGGNSLSLMQIYQLYQKEFKQNALKITDMFRHTTIAEHARFFLQEYNEDQLLNKDWTHLTVIEGPASYAQTSIWKSERVRFVGWPQVAVYNMPAILKIDSGYFSINKCIKVLNEIVSQHWIFRTRLKFDIDRGYLCQKIHQEICYPIDLRMYDDEKEKEIIINEEIETPFDTEHDGVFRCLFIRRYDHEDQNKLLKDDVIIFNFHHGSFDGQATDLFLEQFKLGYEQCKQLQQPHLQYIDYSIQERQLLMIDARNYWYEALKDYGWDRRLDLGALDTSLLSARRRDHGSTYCIKIPSDIAESMIKYADQLNITLFQLGLTCFYLFLTQISSHNRDSCIGINHLNRYRPELTSIIGMFVNVLPCRISIDNLETISFIELINKIQQIFLTIVQYAHLPYDQLIDLHRESNSYLQLPYLQVIFRVDTDFIDYKHMNGIILNDSCFLSNYNLKNVKSPGHFDLELSLMYDKIRETIDCEWSYLHDAFEKSTIEKHANHFILLLTQLFESNSGKQLQLPLNEVIKFKYENMIDYQENNLSISVDSTVDTDQKQEFLNYIRNIFCQVLGCTINDINDDKSFFEQGGTSLKALQAIYLLQQNGSFQIDIQYFFDHPSVAHLAKTISKKLT